MRQQHGLCHPPHIGPTQCSGMYRTVSINAEISLASTRTSHTVAQILLRLVLYRLLRMLDVIAPGVLSLHIFTMNEMLDVHSGTLEPFPGVDRVVDERERHGAKVD